MDPGGSGGASLAALLAAAPQEVRQAHKYALDAAEKVRASNQELRKLARSHKRAEKCVEMCHYCVENVRMVQKEAIIELKKCRTDEAKAIGKVANIVEMQKFAKKTAVKDKLKSKMAAAKASSLLSDFINKAPTKEADDEPLAAGSRRKRSVTPDDEPLAAGSRRERSVTPGSNGDG